MAAAAANANAAGRDIPPQRIVLWPHRSLSRSGAAALLGAVIAGLAVPIMAIGASPVWPLVVPGGLTLAGLSLALWQNTRAARHGEIVTLGPQTLRVSRWGVQGAEPVAEFSAYWVRVSLESDFYVEDRLTLREGRRSYSLGEFLAPEERRALADRLRNALAA